MVSEKTKFHKIKIQNYKNNTCIFIQLIVYEVACDVNWTVFISYEVACDVNWTVFKNFSNCRCLILSALSGLIKSRIILIQSLILEFRINSEIFCFHLCFRLSHRAFLTWLCHWSSRKSSKIELLGLPLWRYDHRFINDCPPSFSSLFHFWKNEKNKN